MSIYEQRSCGLVHGFLRDVLSLNTGAISGRLSSFLFLHDRGDGLFSWCSRLVLFDDRSSRFFRRRCRFLLLGDGDGRFFFFNNRGRSGLFGCSRLFGGDGLLDSCRLFFSCRLFGDNRLLLNRGRSILGNLNLFNRRLRLFNSLHWLFNGRSNRGRLRNLSLFDRRLGSRDSFRLFNGRSGLFGGSRRSLSFGFRFRLGCGFGFGFDSSLAGRTSAVARFGVIHDRLLRDGLRGRLDRCIHNRDSGQLDSRRLDGRFKPQNFGLRFFGRCSGFFSDRLFDGGGRFLNGGSFRL